MALAQDQRPRFYEGQYLGAEDLTAAVAYGRIQEARHALGAHTWGIAIGLQLQEKPLPGGRAEVYLLPGYAWDGFGRPIVVLAPYRLPAEKFSAYKYDQSLDANGTGRLIEIWLRYDESETRNPPPGFEVCGTADQLSRVQESFHIEIGLQQPAHDPVVIAGQPVEAAKALQQFDPNAPLVGDESVPHQQFPVDGQTARWLIPIGYVRWLPAQGGYGSFVPRTDDDVRQIRRVRRHIGVVAEEIAAADGAIRLRSRANAPTTSSFTKEPVPGFLSKDSQKQYYRRSTPALVWVEGPLRVEDDLRLAGHSLDFRDADGQDHDTPLQIRRAGDGVPAAGKRSLQILLGPVAQPDNQLIVGPLKDDNSLEPRLSVRSDGKVGIGAEAVTDPLEVSGNLRVNTGSNALRFTSSWSGFPDGSLSQAEICNDTGFFKTLMLVGNRSGRIGQGLQRRVSVWDRLEVNGDLLVTASASKPGGGAWTSSSDARLKRKIEPLTGALSRLLQLRGISFEWKEPEQMGGLTGPQIGLVAQEVEAVFSTWVGTDPDGYKTVTIRGFEALAVEALRELTAKIDALQTCVAKLEAG
jgi:hypothetical protein